MSNQETIYLARPSIGNPLFLEKKNLRDFELTVSGKWPEIARLSECGHPPTPQKIAQLIALSNPQIEFLNGGPTVPLMLLETPSPDAFQLFQPWEPLVEFEEFLYSEAKLPVTMQSINLIMDRIRQGPMGNIFKLSPDLRLGETAASELYKELYEINVAIPKTNEEYQYACGFRWEWKVRVGLEQDYINQLPLPGLANLYIDDRPHPHAIYVVDEFPDSRHLRFLHITDPHVSLRTDCIPDILFPVGASDLQERERFLQENYRNYNDNLREVITNANRLAQAGDLHFVVITGDLIDYAYDNRWSKEPLPQDSNLDKFIQIVTGGDGRGEALSVPAFMIPGNHEYYRYQVPLATYINPELDEDYWWLGYIPVVGQIGMLGVADANAHYTQSVDKYGSYGLTEEQGIKVDQHYGVPKNIDVSEGLNKLLPRSGQFVDYLEKISFDLDFETEIGPCKLIFLNTGEEIGHPKDKWDVMKPDPNDKHLVNLISDDPDTWGIAGWHLDLLRDSLQENDSEKIVVFTHAPLLHPRSVGEGSRHSTKDIGLTYENIHKNARPTPNMITAWWGWLLRRLHRFGEYGEPCVEYADKPWIQEIVELFENFGEGSIEIPWQAYEHITWRDRTELRHPNWLFGYPRSQVDWSPDNPLKETADALEELGFPQRGTRYFKKGRREPGLDHGVAAQDDNVHELLRVAAGDSSTAKKVDLVLAGHTHHTHEFRVANAEENSIEFYASKYSAFRLREDQKPILVTTTGLKKSKPTVRDVRIRYDEIVSFKELAPDRLTTMPLPPAMDEFEPNESFDQAANIDLSAYPEPEVVLDRLTFHEPDDVDFFKINYPQGDEKFGGVKQDFQCKWFAVETHDAYLLIHAEGKDDWGNYEEAQVVFTLFDSSQTPQDIKQTNNTIKVSTPTETFEDSVVYLRVANSERMLLNYELQLALIGAGSSSWTLEPLTEDRWFDWPWEEVIHGNPADIVETMINKVNEKCKDLELTTQEVEDLAEFQYELASFAEKLNSLETANELYATSAAMYEKLNDYEKAVAALDNLKAVNMELGNTAKVSDINSNIERLDQLIGIS